MQDFRLAGRRFPSKAELDAAGYEIIKLLTDFALSQNQCLTDFRKGTRLYTSMRFRQP